MTEKKKDPNDPPPDFNGAGSGGENVDADLKAEVEKRGCLGYGAGAFALAIVIGVGIYTLGEIGAARLPDGSYEGGKLREGVLLLETVKVVARTVVTIGAIYFAYQLLKIAERMFVPRRLLQDAKDVEVVRAILGIDAPADAALKAAREVVSVAKEATAIVNGGGRGTPEA